MTQRNEYHSWEDLLGDIQVGKFTPEEGQLIKAAYAARDKRGSIIKEVGVLGWSHYENRIFVIEAMTYGSYTRPEEKEYRLHLMYRGDLKWIIPYNWTMNDGTEMYMVDLTIDNERMDKIKQLVEDMGLFGLIARMRLL